jgi:preprotein translocase YajC subunit
VFLLRRGNFIMKPEDSILLVALAALIFMMFWNSRKRKKQAEELQSQLGKGAAIVTHSGIYGVIESIDADRAVIVTAGSKLEIAKAAIRGVDANAKPAAKTVAAKPAAKPAAAKTVAAKPAASKAAAKPVAKAAAKPAAKKPAAK